jgi:hypothetical protein
VPSNENKSEVIGLYLNPEEAQLGKETQEHFQKKRMDEKGLLLPEETFEIRASTR